jgi:hypothetical protein
MPVKLGKKKYEKFSDASAAYVASVERKQGIEPRTGTRTTKKTTTRRKSKK